MATQRVVKKAIVGPSRVRYRVIVTGEPCPPLTQESRQHQQLFINLLAANQTLLECGFSPFQKLSVYHNGSCWEAVAEAEVDEETD